MKSLSNIKVFKNFLNQKDYAKVVEEIFLNGSWNFGWRSVTGVEDVPKFWIMELTDNEYFSIYIKNMIEEKTDMKFNLLRVYANAKTYGQDGMLHDDEPLINGKIKYYTFCLYITPLPNNQLNLIGGELQFKLPELDPDVYELSIMYNPNLGVFFPAHYYHRGRAFNRYTHELRVCIAWKLEIIE